MMSKRKKSRLITAALTALVLLLFTASYTLFLAPYRNQDKWVYKETAVERGKLTVGVTESGSLEYGITSVLYNLDLNVDDDSDDDDDEDETTVKYLEVEEVYTSVGQIIQEGEALLKFTDESLAAVRRLLQSVLIDAQSDYNEAEAEYQLSVLEAETDYKTKLLAAQYGLAAYQTADGAIDDSISSMQVEIEQRTANVSSLEEKIEDVSEDYNDALEVYEAAQKALDQADVGNAANYLAIQKEYLSAQTKYQSALNSLDQAKQALKENEDKIASLTKELAAANAKRTIDKLEAEEDYRTGKISGENAEITYNARIESLKDELQEALDDKQEREEQMEAFENFVGEDGILYADGSGIVTQLGVAAGDKLKEESTVAAYASPDDMTIAVDVTQEDVVALKVGNKVEILFGAYPDTIYEGEILSIDTTATSRSSATISYTVVIGVNGDTSLLYGGMTADITFVTEEKEDVLYVSRKAVVEENGKTYVYVEKKSGDMELKQVETGMSNSMYVEIVSGLEEGELVYIASKVSASASDTDEDGSNGQDVSGSGESSVDGGANGYEFITTPDGDIEGGGFEPDMGGSGPGNNGNKGGMSSPGGIQGGMGTAGMEARP